MNLTQRLVPVEQPPPRRRSGFLAPFRYRDYRLLWSGLIISNLGTWMQLTTLGYLVVKLAGTARLAALDTQMGKELRIYRQHGLAFGGGLAVSNVEHRAILAAVERGDRLNAGAELEKHIQNGRDRFIRAMSATGQLVLKDSASGPSDRKKRSGRTS